MPGSRDHLDQAERADVRGPRPADPQTDRVGRPAITGPADPRLAHGTASTHADLLHVQRTAGNAAVAAMVAPAVQRDVTIGEVETTVDGPQAGATAGGETAGGDAAGGDTGSGAQTITGSHITLDAPVVETPGLLKAQTLMVDNVIATSYSPGVGNVW